MTTPPAPNNFVQLLQYFAPERYRRTAESCDSWEYMLGAEGAFVESPGTTVTCTVLQR